MDVIVDGPKDHVSRSTDGKDDLDNIMSTTLVWSMNPSE